jgi:ankyrin repeat protein
LSLGSKDLKPSDDSKGGGSRRFDNDDDFGDTKSSREARLSFDHKDDRTSKGEISNDEKGGDANKGRIKVSTRARRGDSDFMAHSAESRRSTSGASIGLSLAELESYSHLYERDGSIADDAESCTDLCLDVEEFLTDVSLGRATRSVDLTVTNESILIGSNQHKRQVLQESLTRMGRTNDTELLDLLLSETSDTDKEVGQGNRQKTTDGGVLNYPPYVTVVDIEKLRLQTLEARDGLGRTPLMIAAALGRAQVVQMLIGLGASVTARSPTGHTVLSLSCGAEVRKLVEGSLINWLSDSHTADRSRRVELVDIATMSTEVKGSSSLSTREIFAAAWKTSQMPIGTIHNRQEEFVGRDALEERTLVMSSLTSQLPKLQSERWAYSRPPLSWAVNNALVSVVDSLIGTGASVNEADALGRCPLHLCAATVSSPGVTEASAWASIQIAQLLVSAGAQINAKSVSGRTALHELFCCSADEPSTSFSRLQAASGYKQQLGLKASAVVGSISSKDNGPTDFVALMLKWYVAPRAYCV